MCRLITRTSAVIHQRGHQEPAAAAVAVAVAMLSLLVRTFFFSLLLFGECSLKV